MKRRNFVKRSEHEKDVMLQVTVNSNIKDAIKFISTQKGITMARYLNNFFKDFLEFESKNHGDEYILKKVQEFLKNVKYL